MLWMIGEIGNLFEDPELHLLTKRFIVIYSQLFSFSCRSQTLGKVLSSIWQNIDVNIFSLKAISDLPDGQMFKHFERQHIKMFDMEQYLFCPILDTEKRLATLYFYLLFWVAKLQKAIKINIMRGHSGRTYQCLQIVETS